MSDNSESRSVLKTNVIFGGVKVFQMLVGLIKNKIVALLLGPAGIGIQSLLMTTVNTIYQITNLGVPQSGVRELAVNKTEDDRSKVLLSINYLSILLGLISVVLCLLFSKSLSILVFKSPDYQWCFIIVSFLLLFESILGGEVAILQGLRETKRLALSSLVGAIIALVISVPLYYYWRLEAIPYVLVVGGAISSGTYFYFRYQKIKVKKEFNYQELKAPMLSVLKLGITLMVSNSFMSILVMILNIVIRRCGTNEDVGYYQAAYSCTYSFITILIAILASDYYPRLSEKIEDKAGTCSIINTQMKLFYLIMMPIIALIVCVPNLIINILYSSKFNSIELPVQLMGIALMFRVLWQIFSYVILAKGDRKAFLFLDAFLGNGLFFMGNIVGFYYFGLDGLAVSYLVMSLLVMLMLLTYVKRSYKLNASSSIIVQSIVFTLVSLLIVWVGEYLNTLYSILMKLIYILLSFTICFVSLQKELDIIGGVKSFYTKYFVEK